MKKARLLFVSLYLAFCTLNIMGQELYSNSYLILNNQSSNTEAVSLNFNKQVDLNGYEDQISRVHNSLGDVSLFLVFESPLKVSNILEVANKNLAISENQISGFEEIKLNQGNFPKLITYIESIKYNQDANDPSKLILPKENAIFEAIVFPKSISNLKRKKIETYLGLKYSISLASNYIASKGDTIFDYKENNLFSNNIFGIGRDDISHLYQKQSSDYSRIIQLGINEIVELNSKNNAEIEDYNFLIISDNGEESNFDKQANNGLVASNKVWKAQFFGDDLKNKNYQLIVDQSKLESERENSKDTYWLLINKNSKEKFDYYNATYIKMSLNDEGLNNIENFKLEDFGNDFLFTFARDDEFLIVYETENINCEQKGILKVKAKGEGEEFTFKLHSLNGNEALTKSGKEVVFTELEEGKYHLMVSDSKGQEFQKEILISSEITNNDEENIEVDLVKDSKLILNAKTYLSQDSDSFWWEKEGKTISTKSSLLVEEEGTYRLYEMNKQGCLKSYLFNVINKGDIQNYITTNEGIRLFPNPVKANEEFTIQLNFPNTTDYNYSIYTPDGSLIKSKSFYQKKKFDITDRLTKTGLYLIIIETREQLYSYKLIVN